MTLSLFASHCLALVALLLAGQQMKDQYVIEFPKLEQEVKNKFGADKASHVAALEAALHALESKGVKDQLLGVNAFFDEHIQYATDDIVFKEKDYWATPLEMLSIGGGDCEDYSIAKYFTLKELGVDEDKLRITYVKAKELNQAHMVLTYFKTKRSVPLVLDNLITEIKPASQRNDLTPVYSFNGTGLWLAKSRGWARFVAL